MAVEASAGGLGPAGHTETATCPVCRQPFAGTRQWCSPACKAAAWRQRQAAGPPVVVASPSRGRLPITVYACAGCGARALGRQRCGQCGSPMRKVGLGGACPHCNEPVGVTELLNQEVVLED